jgi:hypothetical protein
MKKRQNYSRRQVVQQLETRFKTLMIGCLSRFEAEFGTLWNNELEPSNTQEEYFRDKWEELRHDILDHGNNQMRQGLEELAEYLNSVDKYHLQVFYNQNKGDQ